MEQFCQRLCILIGIVDKEKIKSLETWDKIKIELLFRQRTVTSCILSAGCHSWGEQGIEIFVRFLK